MSNSWIKVMQGSYRLIYIISLCWITRADCESKSLFSSFDTMAFTAWSTCCWEFHWEAPAEIKPICPTLLSLCQHTSYNKSLFCSLNKTFFSKQVLFHFPQVSRAFHRAKQFDMIHFYKPTWHAKTQAGHRHGKICMIMFGKTFLCLSEVPACVFGKQRLSANATF